MPAMPPCACARVDIMPPPLVWSALKPWRVACGWLWPSLGGAIPMRAPPDVLCCCTICIMAAGDGGGGIDGGGVPGAVSAGDKLAAGVLVATGVDEEEDDDWVSWTCAWEDEEAIGAIAGVVLF